jgi:hypothetical protein
MNNNNGSSAVEPEQCIGTQWVAYGAGSTLARVIATARKMCITVPASTLTADQSIKTNLVVGVPQWDRTDRGRVEVVVTDQYKDVFGSGSERAAVSQVVKVIPIHKPRMCGSCLRGERHVCADWEVRGKTWGRRDTHTPTVPYHAYLCQNHLEMRSADGVALSMERPIEVTEAQRTRYEGGYTASGEYLTPSRYRRLAVASCPPHHHHPRPRGRDDRTGGVA